ADVHWERILWELESSERAIDASEDLFRFNTQTQKPDLPKGRERMYHTLERTGNDGNTIYNTFSPEVRDSSYFNALNQMLRRIECCVGLSYGTISEVADNPKTAEEIRSSKQRSFARVSDIQVNLECALQDLIYAMQYYHNYYNNSNISVELTCTFGDSVLEDTDKEFVRRSQLVTSGALKKEYLISWYFHCSLEEAKEMIPYEPNEPENIDFSMYGGDN
ncbi:MAG: phage portal protein, partial [Ruminococcus sp.]|nr:phage portal protein [Ruminococcus sp.]